jgi:acetyl esterase/lipase
MIHWRQGIDRLETIGELAAEPTRIEVSYGPAPEQSGRLSIPPGKGPHPVAILLHGGFWRSGWGDAKDMERLSRALVRQGIATWNVEYRSVGDLGGGWPGTFKDAASAADHLRLLAKKHSIDPSRTIAIGYSAGGQLALWLAARPRLPKSSLLHRPDPLPLRGVISLAGVSDLAWADEAGLGSGAVSDVLGGNASTKRLAETSPAALLPLGVESVLVHGTRDHYVPYEMSQSLHERALESGDVSELVTLSGQGHEAALHASHVISTAAARLLRE